MMRILVLEGSPVSGECGGGSEGQRNGGDWAAQSVFWRRVQRCGGLKEVGFWGFCYIFFLKAGKIEIRV